MNGPPCNCKLLGSSEGPPLSDMGDFPIASTQKGAVSTGCSKGGAFGTWFDSQLVSTKFQPWVQSHATGPLSMCHRGFWSLVQQLLDCLTWKLTITNLGTKELWKSPEGVVLALGNAWNAAAAASGELCLSRNPRYWHAKFKGTKLSLSYWWVEWWCGQRFDWRLNSRDI